MVDTADNYDHLSAFADSPEMRRIARERQAAMQNAPASESRLGSVVSHAQQGAKSGSIGGPWGALGGAVVGGIYGAVAGDKADDSMVGKALGVTPGSGADVANAKGLYDKGKDYLKKRREDESLGAGDIGDAPVSDVGDTSGYA